MDPLNAEALDGLGAVFESLLPVASDPALASTIAVMPHRIRPTGIGGFVALNDDPRGEIRGRQVEATVVVAARGQGAAGSGEAAAAVSRAVAGQAQDVLRQRGLLRVTLDSVSSPEADTTGGGANQVTRRDLAFEVLFEYLKVPEAAEGAIAEIPINLDVNSA